MILIPDYNCNSFMTSIKKLSISYKTYPINSDLRFNINNLKKKSYQKYKGNSNCKLFWCTIAN